MGGPDRGTSGRENEMDASKDSTTGEGAGSNFSEIGDRFAEHISHQEEICRRLEAIADSLPAAVEAHDCLIVSRSIVPVLRRAHRFEEQILFPAIVLAASNPDETPTMLERLRGEHMEDEDHAEELGDALRRFVRNPTASNVDSLAYLLRGFFEGLRRHLAFDREHILPLLGRKP